MRVSEKERENFRSAANVMNGRKTDFRTAPWLKSEFDAPLWNIDTDQAESTIDFRVRLEDGSLLTDTQHCELLCSLKAFLVIQTHLDFTKGVIYAPGSIGPRLNVAIHICEYLLINSKQLRLAEFGLNALSEADGYAMLKSLATGHSWDSVYQWTDRLRSFLVDKSRSVDKATVDLTVTKQPELARSCESSILAFDHDQLVRARVWLWINYYYSSLAFLESSVLEVDVSRLTLQIYPNGTLKNTWHRRCPPELQVARGPALHREFEGAPIRGGQRTENVFRFYVRAMKGLALLKHAGLPCPQGFIRVTADAGFIQQLETAPLGRFSTVPHDVVLLALNKALEFTIEYGEDLLFAYIDAALLAKSRGLSIDAATNHLYEHGGFCTNLTNLGVTCWSVSQVIRQSWGRGKTGKSLKTLEEAYFLRFRAGHGLHELLYVLGGATLIILGTLMARRQGEIIDLQPESFLNKGKTHLLFRARKSGTQGLRQLLARPIPKIAAELLGLFQAFQLRLVEFNLILKTTNLLAPPKLTEVGLRMLNATSCNLMLDRFCDFFQIPKNPLGQRFYIRQHQLRRFFAMLFFWGSSFSGMDTLRWFLGHSDPEHLYHYISESTPGEVLRSVKVDYVLDTLASPSPDTTPLFQLLESRFGTRDVMLLDAAELGGYIEELLIAGNVKVEPKFFDGPAGKEYMIMIVVTPTGSDL